MALHFQTQEGTLSAELRNLTVAGWTGRDRAAVDHHIEELAAIGVARPSRTPLFYRVSPGLATQDPEIVVLGHETSGEVEPLLIRTAGKLWLGLASDHTDRGLEAQSVAHSKQVCAKPIATQLWPLEQVSGRLDELRLRTWIGAGERRTLYQDGTLSDILPFDQLMAEAPLSDGDAMLCGTLPAIGGIVSAEDYEMEIGAAEIGDIRLHYRVRALDIIR